MIVVLKGNSGNEGKVDYFLKINDSIENLRQAVLMLPFLTFLTE